MILYVTFKLNLDLLVYTGKMIHRSWLFEQVIGVGMRFGRVIDLIQSFQMGAIKHMAYLVMTFFASFRDLNFNSKLFFYFYETLDILSFCTKIGFRFHYCYYYLYVWECSIVFWNKILILCLTTNFGLILEPSNYLSVCNSSLSFNHSFNKIKIFKKLHFSCSLNDGRIILSWQKWTHILNIHIFYSSKSYLILYILNEL